MTQLPSFSGLKTRCVKCRCVEVNIVHCARRGGERLTYFGLVCPRGKFDSKARDYAVVEHFHRTCKACGYEWLEAVPQPDAPATGD